MHYDRSCFLSRCVTTIQKIVSQNRSVFQVYCIAKEGYGVCSDNISERYNRLKAVYAEINRLQSEISNTKTSKICIKLFSLLIAAINPARYNLHKKGKLMMTR